jgi:hypothetical protein
MTKQNPHNPINLLFGILIILMLASCVQTGSTDDQPHTTITSTWVFLSTPLVTQQIPTVTKLPASPTPQISPSATPLPSQNPTITLIPTWTPAPPLARHEAYALVQDLLENNGGCRLPCWWGITPGETDWDTARHFLETFVVQIEQGWEEAVIKDGVSIQQAAYYITYEIESGTAISYIFVENSLVREIEFGEAGAQQGFRLDQLLTNYGPPNETFISAHRYTNDGSPPPFSFILNYAGKHFWADFHLDGKVIGDYVVGCPQSINPRIWVGTAERVWTADALFDYVFGPAVPGFPRYPVLTLKEATGMDIETFTTIFANPDNQKCLETPADLWG